MVIITVTCNSAGGQPISMENIKATYELAKKYDLPVVIDAARFAEKRLLHQATGRRLRG